eukprot:COSAG01_NODE_24228_length_786_cov_0.918486_1_plen_177_part_00
MFIFLSAYLSTHTRAPAARACKRRHARHTEKRAPNRRSAPRAEAASACGKYSSDVARVLDGARGRLVLPHGHRAWAALSQNGVGGQYSTKRSDPTCKRSCLSDGSRAISRQQQAKKAGQQQSPVSWCLLVPHARHWLPTIGTGCLRASAGASDDTQIHVWILSILCGGRVGPRATL